MGAKDSVFFKVLLNRFNPNGSESFLKVLPKEEAQAILKETTSSKNTAAVLTVFDDLLSHIHYSWLASVLNTLPKRVLGATIASLSEPQATGIKKLLKIENLPSQPTPVIKKFLRNEFMKQWQTKETIPLEYLPPSSLTPLLYFSKVQLEELIDFLAIYDLAHALRSIVDRKNLKSIYLCLKPRQQEFLRLCLHKKEKITGPKLSIDKWNGHTENLLSILHRRGLLRFGKALCGQHPQFLWYITHTLDTGRGNIISQYYNEESTPDVTNVLVQQVLSLISFLKQKTQI